jgi:hypothetical protein
MRLGRYLRFRAIPDWLLGRIATELDDLLMVVYQEESGLGCVRRDLDTLRRNYT